MTEETGTPPPVAIDIELDEIVDQKIILWRGSTAAGELDGEVTFEVFAADEAIVDGHRALRRGARLITGTMRSTGCADVHVEPMHLCAFDEWQSVMRVLGHLYVRSWDLMRADPDIQTDPQGYGVLQMAKQAREADRVQGLIDKAVADVQTNGIASIPVKA